MKKAQRDAAAALKKGKKKAKKKKKPAAAPVPVSGASSKNLTGTSTTKLGVAASPDVAGSPPEDS